MRLDGAAVLVTGASRGIGRATAELLARGGARLALAGRDTGALAAVAAATGGTPLTADLAVAGAAARLVADAQAALGGLDAVVANAGIGHAGPVTAMSDDDVAALVDLNVRGTLELARAAASAFAAAGDGHRRGLVFVSSIAGAVWVPGESVYSATKAAVEAFAVTLREELRADGVAVSTVLPGVVATEFHDRRGLPYERRVPRPLPPERVARAVVSALERGTPRTVVPRWLAFPAWLAGAAPGPYRALARRFS